MTNNNYDNYTSISFPKRLITDYKKLNLDEITLISLIKILSFNKRLVNIKNLINEMNVERSELAKLSDLNLISLTEQNNDIYVDLLPFYDKLSSSTNNVIENTNSDVLTTTQIDRFSLILNRSIKPFEVDKLREWLAEGFSLLQIEVAMQKSAVNNVDNFNYIYAVLTNENKESNPNETIEKKFDMFS